MSTCSDRFIRKKATNIKVVCKCGEVFKLDNATYECTDWGSTDPPFEWSRKEKVCPKCHLYHYKYDGEKHIRTGAKVNSFSEVI